MGYAQADERATSAAMQDPQPGDQFTEMYAVFVFVLKRNWDLVTFLEAMGPCNLPEGGKVYTMTLDGFRAKYAYGHGVPGYCISLIKRGEDYSGWAEHHGMSCMPNEVETPVSNYEI